MYDIAIIGSGLGGLLSGYLLSREGKSVCILEKHRKFGGSLQSFKRGDYHFNTGMHYLGSLSPGQTLYRYWSYFGLTALPLKQMDPEGFDRISFPDAEFPMAQSPDLFSETLSARFPGSEAALRSYGETLSGIADSHPLYRLAMPGTGSMHDFERIRFSDFLERLTGTFRQAGGIPLSSVLAGNNILYAGNPSTTPLGMAGLINHSFISSAWRIAGPSQQIADSLAEGIRKHGGTLMPKQEVIRISKSDAGFMLTFREGDPVACRQVISGIHPAATLGMLEGIPVRKVFTDRIRNLANTPSVLSVYLGLKPRQFPYLNHHIHHFTSDRIWVSDTASEERWPSAFLFMTPPATAQSEWAETAMILSPCRFEAFRSWESSLTGRREKPYWVYRTQLAHKLLEEAYKRFPALRSAVATVDVSSPLTWRDYTGTPAGSMFGIERQADHPERCTILPATPIPGLWFTGQNIGLHGAVGVTIGAVRTCGEILGLEYILTKIRDAN